MSAGQRNGSGSNFQEFVSLKREIANLRSANASLTRQLSGQSAALAPEALSTLLSRHNDAIRSAQGPAGVAARQLRSGRR